MDSKLVILFFCVLFLSACGESGQSVKVTSDMSKGMTALYLPGGVGIDFGVAPVTDRVVDYKGRDVRVVTYQLDSDTADIDSELSAILQSEGYKRIEVPKGTNDLTVTYHNPSGKILFRYKKQVSEGLLKYTRLVVSWRI